MKKILDIFKKNKGALVFIIAINLFVLITNLTVWFDGTMSAGLITGILIFVTIVDLLAVLQVWREYKGYEGLFGRK
mgnify:CR=1 FL=1